MFWQSVQDLEREKGWNERNRNAFEKQQRQHIHKQQWEAVRHKHSSKSARSTAQFSNAAKDDNTKSALLLHDDSADVPVMRESHRIADEVEQQKLSTNLNTTSTAESKDEMQLSHLTDIASTKHDIIAEPRRCHRCDKIGHTANACPFFRKDRDNHSDAGWGDTTPHLQQTQIFINVQGEPVERNQRLPGWWIGQQLEISVDSIWFALGSASGECCNCLIDTLRQVMPTFICDVPSVRAELERRHARRSTAIIQFDYLDLAMYWSDIIDIIGQKIVWPEWQTVPQNVVFVA